MKTLKNSFRCTLLIAAILICGCTNKVYQTQATDLHDYETVSAVVVNPIIDNDKVANSMGISLTATLTDYLAADIRYAGDIPKLQPSLLKNNLVADGQINMTELSKIGSAVNAKEVICVKVNSSHLYPPQSMSALVIIRSSEGSKYRQKVGYINISMQNVNHKNEYMQFVGGDLKTPLGDKATRKTNINGEVGLLSNDDFAKFVGYKIAKQVIYMKKY